jgi:hypothetical protein
MVDEAAPTSPTDGKSREELEAEVERLQAELEEGQRRTSTKLRSVASVVLVVLTAISITLAAIAWWVHSIALDNEAFMEVVEPAVTSDEFKTALGGRIGDEAVAALDLEARLTERLTAVDEFLGEQLIEALDLGPRVRQLLQGLDVPRLADLAGPIANAANERIRTAALNVVRSDQFETVMVGAIQRGHEAGVALVQGDLEALPNVYIEGDQLRWNAVPVVVATIQTIIEQGLLGGEEINLPDLSDNPIAAAAIARLAESLGRQLPDDFGQFTLMSSDELGALQGYADMFDRAVWLTIILAVALIAVTLWVSPHRRRTLIQLCVATIIALVLAGVAVRRIAGSVQENIVNLEIREAFGSVLEELQGSAQSLGIWILVIAALVAFLTWLAGRPEQVEKWIAAGRKATDRSGETSSVDQFVARHFDILAVALVVLTLVLAWFAAPGWFWGLVIAAVVGLLIWYGLSARARYELSQMAEEGAEPAEAVAAAVTETEDG